MWLVQSLLNVNSSAREPECVILVFNLQIGYPIPAVMSALGPSSMETLFHIEYI